MIIMKQLKKCIHGQIKYMMKNGIIVFKEQMTKRIKRSEKVKGIKERNSL